jgi:hypothetical protein
LPLETDGKDNNISIPDMQNETKNDVKCKIYKQTALISK